MKNVLFVTSYTPSRFSAGQNFTKNLLADLSQKNKIDVVYFQYQSQVYTPDSENINIVKRIPVTPLSRILNSILCPLFHPIFSVRFSFATLLFLKSLIRKKRYDVIFFDFSQVFLYSLFFGNQDKILIAHDILFQKFKRQGSMLEQSWIFRIERMLFRQRNIQIYTFSDKDRLLIQDHLGNSSQVINFYLSPKILEQKAGLSPDNYFCFFAAWNRPENHEGLRWFVKEVLPQTGMCQFVILGASMPSDLTEIIRKTKNVRYMGFVENPYSIIANAKALIAPLFKGAGVKVKVIESLACGTPAIGTHIALEGVPEVVTRSLVECKSSAEFIHEIVNFHFPLNDKVTLKKSFLDFYNDETRKIVL